MFFFVKILFFNKFFEFLSEISPYYYSFAVSLFTSIVLEKRITQPNCTEYKHKS